MCVPEFNMKALKNLIPKPVDNPTLVIMLMHEIITWIGGIGDLVQFTHLPLHELLWIVMSHSIMGTKKKYTISSHLCYHH